MKLYMFRTVPHSIIRNLFTVHSKQWYMSHRFLDTFRAGPGPSRKLSETFRVSCQNEFVKLAHLVGFIIKKFVTIHGHMNVKKVCCTVYNSHNKQTNS
jgi:hypothetical protein